MNAVLALGFIGAGTNNARLAGMLRQLSSYYYKCVCSPNEGHLSVLGFGLLGGSVATWQACCSNSAATATSERTFGCAWKG